MLRSGRCVTGIREPDMLTGMTERDWLIALELFDAVQSRRGEPGHDDRKFLEAIHYFSVHSITWRALPEEFGNWNRCMEAVLEAQPIGCIRGILSDARSMQRHGPSDPVLRQHDRTRSRFSSRCQRGQQHQALGRSRGGFSTKIHLKTDLDGRPPDFHLTRGEPATARSSRPRSTSARTSARASR